MYYIAVYDVEEARVGKALKLFRKYLNWVQNSVFEGHLTEGQYEKLKAEVKSTLQLDKDSILFYSVSDQKFLQKTFLGVEKNQTDNFI